MNPIARQMYAPRVADADTTVRLGVGVVVKDTAGRVLLEKRSDCSMWGLPGGRVEPGESVTETAIREVKEETGFTVEITRLLGIYSEPQERIVTFPDNVVQLVDVVLEAKIISGQLTVSEESETLAFFEPASFPPDIVPPAKGPVQDLIDGCVGIIR